MNPYFLPGSFMAMGALQATSMSRFAEGMAGSSLFIHQEDDPNGGGGGPISEAPFSRSDAFALDHLASDIAHRLAQLRHNNGVATLADEDAPQIWDALRDWFRNRLQQPRADAGEIAESARLALDTLDEIILLKETQNFFSDGISGFNEFLSRIGHDYDEFGPFLFKQLSVYRADRDKAEDKFLVPYREACAELEGIIADTREHFPFKGFRMVSRMKERILRKLRVRGMSHMKEYYDIAGIRVLTGCHEEVPAAVAVIQGALMATRARMFLPGASPQYYVPRPPDVKDEQPEYTNRGYFGTHIDVDQFKADGSSMPIGEIQVRSEGMEAFLKNQGGLLYKDSPLSKNDAKRLEGYCGQAGRFTLDRESGRREIERPVLDASIINEIRDAEARNCIRRHYRGMEKHLDEYEKLPQAR